HPHPGLGRLPRRPGAAAPDAPPEPADPQAPRGRGGQGQAGEGRDAAAAPERARPHHGRQVAPLPRLRPAPPGARRGGGARPLLLRPAHLPAPARAAAAGGGARHAAHPRAGARLLPRRRPGGHHRAQERADGRGDRAPDRLLPRPRPLGPQLPRGAGRRRPHRRHRPDGRAGARTLRPTTLPGEGLTMRFRHTVARRALGFWIVLGLLPFLSHRGKAQALPSTTLTFSSTADTYVDSGSATKNFNSSTILRAAASPTRVTYLRFAVTGVSGRQVQKPQLVLTVAAQAPTVTIAQPPTGASYFTGDAITLQASAHDSAGVDLSTHVVWSSNLAGPLGTGAVVTTSLGQGTHTLTATVTDGQGLTGSSQISVTVTPPPPGNTAPLVSITAPTSGQTLAASATITFTGSASDLEDGDVTTAISWTSDRDGALGTGGT